MQDQDPIARLTDREREVLALVAHGKANKEIARDLSIRPETVKGHLRYIYVKLDAANRAEAAALWVRAGGGRLNEPPQRCLAG